MLSSKHLVPKQSAHHFITPLLLTVKKASIVLHPFAAFFQDALWQNLVAQDSPVYTTGRLHFPGCRDFNCQKFNYRQLQLLTWIDFECPESYLAYNIQVTVMDSSETLSSEGLYAHPLPKSCWTEWTEVNVFLAFCLCSLAFTAFLVGRGIVQDLVRTGSKKECPRT